MNMSLFLPLFVAYSEILFYVNSQRHHLTSNEQMQDKQFFWEQNVKVHAFILEQERCTGRMVEIFHDLLVRKTRMAWNTWRAFVEDDQKTHMQKCSQIDKIVTLTLAATRRQGILQVGRFFHKWQIRNCENKFGDDKIRRQLERCFAIRNSLLLLQSFRQWHVRKAEMQRKECVEKQQAMFLRRCVANYQRRALFCHFSRWRKNAKSLQVQDSLKQAENRYKRIQILLMVTIKRHYNVLGSCFSMWAHKTTSSIQWEKRMLAGFRTLDRIVERLHFHRAKVTLFEWREAVRAQIYARHALKTLIKRRFGNRNSISRAWCNWKMFDKLKVQRTFFVEDQNRQRRNAAKQINYFVSKFQKIHVYKIFSAWRKQYERNKNQKRQKKIAAKKIKYFTSKLQKIHVYKTFSAWRRRYERNKQDSCNKHESISRIWKVLRRFQSESVAHAFRRWYQKCLDEVLRQSAFSSRIRHTFNILRRNSLGSYFHTWKVWLYASRDALNNWQKRKKYIVTRLVKRLACRELLNSFGLWVQYTNHHRIHRFQLKIEAETRLRQLEEIDMATRERIEKRVQGLEKIHLITKRLQLMWISKCFRRLLDATKEKKRFRDILKNVEVRLQYASSMRVHRALLRWKEHAFRMHQRESCHTQSITIIQRVVARLQYRDISRAWATWRKNSAALQELFHAKKYQKQKLRIFSFSMRRWIKRQQRVILSQRFAHWALIRKQEREDDLAIGRKYIAQQLCLRKLNRKNIHRNVVGAFLQWKDFARTALQQISHNQKLEKLKSRLSQAQKQYSMYKLSVLLKRKSNAIQQNALRKWHHNSLMVKRSDLIVIRKRVRQVQQQSGMALMNKFLKRKVEIMMLRSLLRWKIVVAVAKHGNDLRFVKSLRKDMQNTVSQSEKEVNDSLLSLLSQPKSPSKTSTKEGAESPMRAFKEGSPFISPVNGNGFLQPQLDLHASVLDISDDHEKMKNRMHRVFEEANSYHQKSMDWEREQSLSRLEQRLSKLRHTPQRQRILSKALPLSTNNERPARDFNQKGDLNGVEQYSAQNDNIKHASSLLQRTRELTNSLRKYNISNKNLSLPPVPPTSQRKFYKRWRHLQLSNALQHWKGVCRRLKRESDRKHLTRIDEKIQKLRGGPINSDSLYLQRLQQKYLSGPAHREKQKMQKHRKRLIEAHDTRALLAIAGKNADNNIVTKSESLLMKSLLDWKLSALKLHIETNKS